MDTITFPDILTAVVSILCASVFYSHLLTAKRNKWGSFLVLLLAETVLGFSMLIFLQSQLLLKLLIYLAADMLLMSVLYEGTLARKLLLFVVNYAASIIGETIAYFAYTAYIKASGTDENYFLLHVFLEIFLTLSYMLAILMLKRDRYTRLNLRETIAVGTMLLVSFFQASMNIILTDPVMPFHVTISTELFTAFNLIAGFIVSIILLYTVRSISRSRYIETENALLAEQNERQLEHYEALLSYQNEIRELRHDVTNHIETAMTLFKDGNSEKAEAYISELRQRYRSLSAIDFCDNPVIDALLRNKAQLLEEKEIDYTFTVKIKRDCGIDDLALVCVFSNLLDNAIEASGNYGEGAFVRLSAKENAGYLFIRCENTVSAQIKPAKRDDGLAHGLGTGIIERTAAEHDGVYERVITENVCECICSLRINRENENKNRSLGNKGISTEVNIMPQSAEELL